MEELNGARESLHGTVAVLVVESQRGDSKVDVSHSSFVLGTREYLKCLRIRDACCCKVSCLSLNITHRFPRIAQSDGELSSSEKPDCFGYVF
jgi:hypothetical protein